MIWRGKNFEIDLSRRPLVMGILNVTLDSFSDGGKFLDPSRAVEQALRMTAEGADIIDIGGESTRPGAEPVSEEEELRRVLPVIEEIVECGMRNAEWKALISIDTSKAAVARAALDCGADIVNDVTGLLGDPEMVSVVRDAGAAAVVMHMQGTPRTMQQTPHYGDVVAEVRDFFRQSHARITSSGVNPMNLAYDPGIGFGKTVAHNLALIKNLGALRVEDRPLVLGVSRKSFIGKILGTKDMESRNAPTVALTALGLAAGANIVRVHDVKPNLQALRVAQAVLQDA